VDQYLKSVDSDWYKPRLSAATFIVFAAFTLIISRLFYLQIIEGKDYRNLSENNCIRLQKIKPIRGLIYDRDGLLMVDNRPSFNLGIVKKDAAPLDETLGKLAEYAGISEAEIAAALEKQKGVPSFKPAWIKKDISRDMLAAVEVHHFDLPGVFVDIQARRHYIHQDAPHIVGYLGEISADELKSGLYPDIQGGDFIGKYGIERVGENLLRGASGGRQVEVDAKGKVVRVLQTVDAVPGNNLYLTIRYDVQQKAAALLREEAGAVVVVRPDNGEVIAMASSPAFDQNAFINGFTPEQWQAIVDSPSHPLQNKAIRGVYPPASTYKIVTAMAGLEERAVQEDTQVFCPGYLNYGDRIFRCWKQSGHGSVDVIDALGGSCDVYFYQVGLRLGVDKLAHYAELCGLGHPTGIELPDEERGLVPTSAWKRQRFKVPWQKGETLSVAIGQGYNLATPLQMAVLTGAVGNGGILRQPHIIQKVVSPQGETLSFGSTAKPTRLPCSDKTLSLIQKGLWAVVNDKQGTAPLAKVPGVEVMGKTGTAQVFGWKDSDLKRKKNLKERLKPHAWFVAYARKGEDQIAIAVIVEHGEKGSDVAAPIAAELIKTYFHIEEPIQPVETTDAMND